MANVKAGVEIKINLPKVYLTVNKEKRIARLKIIKSRFIDKSFFGFKVIDLDIYKNHNNPIEFKFQFIVEYDNETMTKEMYESFVLNVNTIVDAIEKNMK